MPLGGHFYTAANNLIDVMVEPIVARCALMMKQYSFCEIARVLRWMEIMMVFHVKDSLRKKLVRDIYSGNKKAPKGAFY